MGLEELFYFTDGCHKILGKLLMRNFSYDNKEAGSGAHDSVSFIWLVADTKISADRDPPPFFPLPVATLHPWSFHQSGRHAAQRSSQHPVKFVEISSPGHGR
jgi:hypothetical protein